jgi:putative redox protein
MKLTAKWTEKMKFTASADGHTVEMDTRSPLGTDSALTPKQLVLAGVCGCTAMDVVALLKKYKQTVESFEVRAESQKTDHGHPEMFKTIHLEFDVRGEIEPAKMLEAVTLSQTKYCGVSAMISKACPITYRVTVNGKEVGTGKADFKVG